MDDESNLSYNELYDAFKILYDEYKKLGSKYSSLKKSQACLLFKKDILEKKTYIVVDDSNKMDQLKEENKVLKAKIDKLNNTLAKSTQGSKILKVMLASQRCVFNKRTKSIWKITLLKSSNHMTQTIYTIIIEPLIIWFIHVIL